MDLVNGMRAFLGGGSGRDRHRYHPLRSPRSSTATNLESDDGDGEYDGYDSDDDYNYIDSEVNSGHDMNGRRTNGGLRPGHTMEPLLYAEPVSAGGRKRMRTADGFYGDHSGYSRYSAYRDGVLDSIWARGNRRFLKLTLLAVSFGLIMYLGMIVSRVSKLPTNLEMCDTIDHGYQCYSRIAPFWGQYSPFYSVASSLKETDTPQHDDDGGSSRRPVDSSPFAPPRGSRPSTPTHTSKHLPAGCRFTFAQVLSRHGARAPTAGRAAAYEELITRIQNTSADSLVDGPDGNFAFLRRYQYSMGADELSRFGERQMVHSGAHFYRRYRSLLLGLGTPDAHVDPFVRSADQHRVVLSAINWVEGFQAARRSDRAAPKTGGGAHHDNENGSGGSTSIVLLPEAAGFNNTLSYNGLCKAFSAHAGTVAQSTFAATFLPAITARLRHSLHGADLSDADIIALMDMCPFDTVADDLGDADDGDKGQNEGAVGVPGGRRLSPFCDLFTDDEWRDYDYYQTLGKWYGFGDGSALGATQGVGFVNELIARLTGAPVDDHTSTNRTLDADPATFPLNASVYADFSHDNDMANVFAALGLYNSTADGSAALAPSNTTRTTPEDLRGYAASWTVPFAARMYVEKMVCGSAPDEELVRILVNDRVVPLVGCGADHLGRCRVDRFVDSLSFARSGGRWNDCFA